MTTTGHVMKAVLVGSTLRCPVCERGRMFPALSYDMRDDCPVCGARFERARGEFTGALMGMVGTVGLVALMGWFYLEFWTGAPEWFKWGWLAFWALLFPLAFYRNAKGAWVGLVHGTAGLAHDPDRVPRDEPNAP